MTQFIPHGAITLTAYEDMDLDISFYHYYKSTEKFVSLMEDYEKHPEKYSSDPALFNNDELGLGSTEDRERIYFEDKFNDSKSAPEKVSLKCGESITLSDYGYGFSMCRKHHLQAHHLLNADIIVQNNESDSLISVCSINSN